MNPIDLRKHFVLPAWRVAHLKRCSLHQRQRRHQFARRILQDDNCCSVQLAVHEQIILVHILLYEGLILLRVAPANHQIVLARDEPYKFLEPKYLSLHRPKLRLLKFSQILSRSHLRLLNSRNSRILRLKFFIIRFLLNLKVPHHIELSRYTQIHIDLHHRLEVVDQAVIDL